MANAKCHETVILRACKFQDRPGRGEGGDAASASNGDAEAVNDAKVNKSTADVDAIDRASHRAESTAGWA